MQRRSPCFVDCHMCGGPLCVATQQSYAGPAALCSSPPQEGGGDLKRAVGNVWAACDAFAKAGLDNKAALFKGMAGVMAVLKDTLREVCWPCDWHALFLCGFLQPAQAPCHYLRCANWRLQVA